MNGIAGYPFINHIALCVFQNQGRSGQFFSGCCADLGNLHTASGRLIIHHYFVAAVGKFAILNRKSNFFSYLISIRSGHFCQSVFSIWQGKLARGIGRLPGFHYFTILCNGQRCSRKLFPGGNILFGNFNPFAERLIIHGNFAAFHGTVLDGKDDLFRNLVSIRCCNLRQFIGSIFWIVDLMRSIG